VNNPNREKVDLKFVEYLTRTGQLPTRILKYLTRTGQLLTRLPIFLTRTGQPLTRLAIFLTSESIFLTNAPFFFVEVSQYAEQNYTSPDESSRVLPGILVSCCSFSRPAENKAVLLQILVPC
jgi:hypothetical protein